MGEIHIDNVIMRRPHLTTLSAAHHLHLIMIATAAMALLLQLLPASASGSGSGSGSTPPAPAAAEAAAVHFSEINSKHPPPHLNLHLSTTNHTSTNIVHCPPGYAPRRILTKEGGQKVECIKVASRRNHRRRLYTGGRRRPKVGPPVLGARWGGESLSHTFYQDSCPKLESIVQTKIVEWIEKDITLAASLLRLHSQDCLVTGCDASILLRDPISQSTEMHSVYSNGLRGFHVVDDIKLAVEHECPGIVSCADILTLMARDAVLQMGGPFWFVLLGRRDSLTSRKEDVAMQLPRPDSDADNLIKKFEEMGLSFADLAALLGAHSVGMAHCFSLTTPNYINPKLNASYMQHLWRQCSILSSGGSMHAGGKEQQRPLALVPNDPISPFLMDVVYYKNLKNNMGLFRSDQSLYSKGKDGNKMTRAMVEAFLTQPSFWESQFAVSMVNLGSVGVLAGAHQGEIRHVCSTRNPPVHPCRHGACHQ